MSSPESGPPVESMAVYALLDAAGEVLTECKILSVDESNDVAYAVDYAPTGGGFRLQNLSALLETGRLVAVNEEDS